MREELEQTRRWVEDFVVKLDLCPFAGGPLRAGAVRFALCESADLGALLEALLQEMQALEGLPSPNTTLLVMPQGPAGLDDFLDLVDAAQELLSAVNLEGELQLAAFHPRWQFADAPPEDPSHAVQRSPFPTLHLLRWEDVRRAAAHHPDTSAIPTRNAQLLRERAAAVR